MTITIQQKADDFFLHNHSVTLASLLAPVNDAQPAGQTLRGSPVYTAIEKARRQDDPSIPMGEWEYELKRADWNQVCSLALDGLQQSKDMQLVAWLLEAQINQRGFAGIAPCLVLMEQLCRQYWSFLHPRTDEGDYGHRANIIRWMAEKLLPTLHLVPLIDDGIEDKYNWTHWEEAQRNEYLRSTTSHTNNAPAIEGISLQVLNQRISATPTWQFQLFHQQLGDALEGLALLNETLDQLLGDEAPSLGSMKSLLEQMLVCFEMELARRPKPIASPLVEATAPGQNPLLAVAAPEMSAKPSNGVLGSREEAYARLAETAEFLMSLEPHSPVPYLVKRATEWGGLNTVELYQELFLKLNGQLNIFEMLGLEAGASPAHI